MLKSIRNLTILSLLMIISNFSFSQTTYVPKRYWTFNTSNATTDSTGNGSLNLTGYGGQYTIENNGRVGKNLNLDLNSNLISGGNITLNQGLTIEFLIKPGKDFETSKLFQRQDGAFYIAIEYPKITFGTKVGSTTDEFNIILDGIGRKSYNYYVDGNWHHLVFKYNAATGLKQIWVDGELPVGFSKTASIGTFSNPANSTAIFFSSTVNYVRYYGSIDECAIYDVAIPDKLIYKHYLGLQQGQTYDYVDNYTGTIPVANSVTAGIDLNEFAPGHPNVTTLPTTQLLKFPNPRYKPGHTLMRNYNWMDKNYMGGQFQNWSPNSTTVAQYGTELQIELAKNFNYYFNLDLWQSTDPRFTIPRDYLNANLNVPISITILRAQLNGNNPDLKSQTKPNSYYLQNSNGEFLNENGTVITSNKVWRPTAPANGYIADGNTILSGLNSLTTLNRNIAIINENAELFPHITNAAMALDPAVTSDKNSTGLSWENYLGLRIKDNETQSYRNVFMAHPKLVNGIFTEYLLDGHPVYNSGYQYRRLINYQINGQYYSTGDFYVRWPSNWRYWTAAWHGWQWFVESRHVELSLGDKFYSPFISAGWDVNEEINLRPSQWLGLLKNHTAFGAEFFYAGFFNLSAPWPDSRNWIWQAAIPSYAQAVTSRVESLFKNSNVMPGDEPDSRINPVNPGYQFRTGDKSKLVVIRKHNSKNEYYITASINPYSNMMGAAPNVSPATINLDGTNITFNVRKQGSVYFYNSTTNVFYQLDGWHEAGHPYNWSTNFELEGELADKGNYTIATEPVLNHNFTNFTSYITSTDTIFYNIDVREVGNYGFYIKLKNLISGNNSELKIIVDNNSPKTIGCINDTTWNWFKKEKGNGTDIVFNNLSIGYHTIKLISNNINLAIDKILFTKSTPSISPLINSICTNSSANIIANGPTTFCQGGSVTLSANTGSAYLWSNGATTQNITVSTSGSYSCTITTINGVATSNVINVIVNSLPVATITPSGSTSFCQGGNVTLTASTGNSYLWNTGATTQSITVNTSNNYVVTITNTNGCSKISNPLTVTVNSLPTATITPSGATTFCQGGNVTLTASNGNSYLWSNGETTNSINISNTGNFYVTVTNTNGCSASSSTISINVNSLPNAIITPSGATTFCQGENVILNASAGSSYLWSNGATESSITINNSGNFYVTVTNANGCSKMSSPVLVTVNPSTNAIVTINGSTSLCDGETVGLNSTTANSYLWNTGATTQTIYTNSPGNYFVTITNDFGCTSQSIPITITLNPLPDVAITTNGPTSFCQNGNVTLIANGGNQYLWSTGATTQSIVVNQTGAYSVMVINSNGCSNTSQTINTIVYQLPNITTTPSGQISLCNGETVLLTANGGNQYLWSTGATTQSIVVNSAGNYIVTSTDINGCVAQSNTVSVSITNCNTCSTPTNTFHSNIESTSVKLNWNPVVNATLGYTIRLKDLTHGGTIYLNTRNDSITITVLSGTKYRWAVRSKCSIGLKSNYSANKTFKTPSSRLLNNENFSTINNTIVIPGPNCKIDDFDLYPNPANTSVSLCFKSPIQSKVIIYFYNKSGQIVKIHTMNSVADVNTITLNINELLPGLYNVRIVSDSFMYSKQLTIIK